MTANPALAAALHAGGRITVPARDPWWIIGSAAVALHGVGPGSVSDIDVLFSPVDADRILPETGLAPRPGPFDPMFRSSRFARWSGTTLPIEFMAAFHHRTDDASRRPVCPDTRQAFPIDGTGVFAPDETMMIPCSHG